MHYLPQLTYNTHAMHISSAIYISIMHIWSAIYADIYYIVCMHILQIICVICLRLHTIRITRRHAATSSAQFNYTAKMRQNRLHTGLICGTVPGTPSIRQHTSAYVSITCVRGQEHPTVDVKVRASLALSTSAWERALRCRGVQRVFWHTQLSLSLTLHKKHILSLSLSIEYICYICYQEGSTGWY